MKLSAFVLAGLSVAAFAQAPEPKPDQTWNIEVTEVMPDGKTKQVAVFTVRDCGFTHSAYRLRPPRENVKAACNMVKVARNFVAEQTKAQTPAK